MTDQTEPNPPRQRDWSRIGAYVVVGGIVVAFLFNLVLLALDAPGFAFTFPLCVVSLGFIAGVVISARSKRERRHGR